MEPPAAAPTPDAHKLQPKNSGARWSPEQDEWLLKAVRKLGTAECALRMERTHSSIVMRLCLHATKQLAEDSSLTPEDIAPALKISAYDIEKYVKKIAALELSAAKKKAEREAEKAVAADAPSGSAAADAAEGSAAADPASENAGTRWKTQDDAWLLDAIATRDFVECASYLGRTRSAIIARLCFHAASRLADDVSLALEDVASDLKISAYCNRIQAKLAKIAAVAASRDVRTR
jgi:hypothetical protein